MLFKKRKKTVDSKEVGLEIGLMIFKFFLKTEYLHYGYFKNGLTPDIASLKEAQENYAKMLFSKIPKETKTILDVGCGSGKTAQQLAERGYKVDCVSPGKLLTEYAKKVVCKNTEIFNCKFEDLGERVNGNKYDLVLFSESFQYIPMEKSIPLALKLLNPGGHIMVCDFFKKDPNGHCKMGGGHDYGKWLKFKDSYPIKTIIERDITNETAPTVDIVNTFTVDVLHPTWNLLWELGEDRYPGLIKFIRWKWRKKIAKKEQRHFTGQRTGENFRSYKKYMFYLFQGV